MSLMIRRKLLKITRGATVWKINNMATVHKMAKDGFKDGSHYDKSRPSYTTEIVNHVANSLCKTSNKDVKYNILELGAGTGLFTRKVLSVLPKDIRYMATDPSEEFLSTLKSQSPDLEAKVVSASSIPLPDASVENILCAQCFHWFASEENLIEMTRVLVPGGRIMLVYNNKQRSTDWIAKMEGILSEYYGNTPRKISGKWKEVMDAFQGLKFVEHKFMAGNPDLTGDKQFVVNHFTSISVIAQLGDDEKARAIAKFRAVLDELYPGDQSITVTLESEFYCAEKM